MELLERKLSLLRQLAKENGRILCVPLFSEGLYQTFDYPSGCDSFIGSVDDCIKWEKGYCCQTAAHKRKRKNE